MAYPVRNEAETVKRPTTIATDRPLEMNPMAVAAWTRVQQACEVERPRAMPTALILDGTSDHMPMLSADETGFDTVMRIVRFPIFNNGIKVNRCRCCADGEFVAEDHRKWAFRAGRLIDSLENVSILDFTTAGWSEMFAYEFERSMHPE